MKTQKFEFAIDQKCTIWHRLSFDIEAETKEQAIEFLKQQIQKINTSDDILNLPNIEQTTSHYLYETVEDMTVEENNGSHIFELVDEEKHEVICNEFGQKIG